MDLASRVDGYLVARADLEARVVVRTEVHERLARGGIGLFIDSARELNVARRVGLRARESARRELLRVNEERWRLRAGRGRGERGDAVLDVRTRRAVGVVGLNVEDYRDDIGLKPEARA